MRKKFVVPVLREEAALARLTLGFNVVSTGGGCGITCLDGVGGIG
jgi:hypothetical protein